jgi:GDPmannose 4,6-dehydratase
VPVLLGDPSKAERELNWRPTVTFDKLAKMMYESDLQLVKEQINGIKEKP